MAAAPQGGRATDAGGVGRCRSYARDPDGGEVVLVDWAVPAEAGGKEGLELVAERLGRVPVTGAKDAPTGTGRRRFLRRSVRDATDGSPWFQAWMIPLAALALTGPHAWAVMVRDGLAVSGLGDHVSWGLYIANFTFMVGLAAGGVMMVIPAYPYHDHEMRTSPSWASCGRCLPLCLKNRRRV